ncbi:MAG: efflux RND transporter permease subunit [Alistipes sp.]|jgi:HAE1 family hydrophobic/amphiphilic exporter-1|nr:efflux RND transporter permease subunit [Alistipes sp.]
MKIYETAVRKPVSTVMIFIAVLVMGAFSLRNLAIDMYPEMDMPMLMVMTSYPGANATDIETNITRVLEDQLNTVNNLKELTSNSADNFSLIMLELEWGSDVTEAANDVRDVISRTTGLLPDEAEDPTVWKFSSSMIPIAYLSVTARESYPALSKILDEKLVNTLNRIDGVGAVGIDGAPTREVQINVDPNKLAAYGLTVEALGSIIAAENVNIPAGTMDIGNHTFNVKADGEFTSSDDLRSVVVSNAGGRTVLLSDVAQIRDTLAKRTQTQHFNGEDGVMIVIQKQTGANTVQIVDKVFEALPAIQASLPPDVRLDVIMDGSESIRDSISSLSEAVMFAFIFVILVVMFFLGRWRATFIICLTIPISLIVAFIYLYATGSTLNIISLSSLSIAIGMVVDDAIVVLENITTHIERGSKPKEAAIYGTNEVWLAVIATTLVVVAVFMPFTMLGGMAGVMFKELGWIVSIVIVTSTVAAISLTPMLSAYLLRIDGGVHTYKGIGIIYKPVDRFLAWLDEFYARTLTWVVRNRKKTFFGTMGLFVVSLAMLAFVPMEFFPAQDNAMITATVELDQNISVEYTGRIENRINEIINEKYPEVIILAGTAGATSSGDIFAAMNDNGSNIISYMLRLPRLSEREGGRTIFEISDLLRADLEAIPEIRTFTVTPGGQSGGMAGTSTVDVKVFGYDMNATNTVALELRDKLAALDGTRDVQLSRDELRPEYNVTFDRAKLAYYGIPGATAATFVRNRINGLDASKYREDGDEYDIVVRYAEPFRESFEDVENITLYGAQGQPVRLREVATVREEFAAPTIQRENRQRIVTVQSTVGDGYALGDVVTEVNALLEGPAGETWITRLMRFFGKEDATVAHEPFELPEGVTLEVGGSMEDMEDMMIDFMTLLVLVVVLVYIVMATQFESLKMPFIIMFTLPFAFTGVFFALLVTGTPLSMIAMIGAIMLVGIVTKNGIVMVDYTNLLIERGVSTRQAVVASGKSRLRPVLMTSVTTILGMLPMALGLGDGSELWQPMGIAIIGGMIFSTLLTLFVIPAIYTMFQLRKDNRAARRS